MWTSNRRHIYRVYGIRLHPNGVFSNVLMQNQRHENRKTSDLSKSDCSVHGRYRQRYLRVRVFNNFVNNVDIEPWSRILCSRHPITSDCRVSNVLMKKKRQSNRKTSEWSKSDCSVRGRYQQRYLVYYKRYRNEFLQRRIRSETVSSDEIWAGYCKKHWSYSRSYNLRQVNY